MVYMEENLASGSSHHDCDTCTWHTVTGANRLHNKKVWVAGGHATVESETETVLKSTGRQKVDSVVTPSHRLLPAPPPPFPQVADFILAKPLSL